MRILMLTNAMDAGGVETHILALAEALCRRGHFVTVASAGGAMVDALRAVGATHVRIPFHRRSPLSLGLARRRLFRLLQAEPWDIVHAHARLPALLAASMTAKMGLCFVTTIHAKFSAGLLARRFSRWGRASVAVCEELRAHLCRNFSVDVSDVCVIPNGIDTAHFSPPPTRSAAGCHVLCMSRLDLDCAQAALTLFRILPQLASRFPDLRVTVVGGGRAYHTVEREARRVQAASGATVRMVGRVDDPAPLLRECDVFVGVSRGAMEAMACGASVVLCGNEGFAGLLDESALAKAAETNFCARGCGEMTADKLLSALCTALSESESQKAARRQAMRRYAETVLSIERMTDATQLFYKQVQSTQVRGGEEILLCGYYGFHNAGDDALLRAALTRARSSFAGQGISILMKQREARGASFGARVVSRRNPFDVWRALRHARVLVFGGGTLLQDLTSRRSLWYYTSLLRHAQKRGVACELWGNGIGPLLGRGSERCVADCLRRCRFVGLRDRQSFSLATRLMGERAVYEGDLAMGLSAAPRDAADYLWRDLGLSEDGHYVLVAPKKIGDGLWRQLEGALRRERVRGKTLLVAALYPSQDEKACLRLCRCMDGIYLGAPSPAMLTAIAARCERVYGMRLHALVFAASVGTPFVAVGTDPKLCAFATEQNMGTLFSENFS